MHFLRKLWAQPVWLLWAAPLIWATNIVIGRAVAHSFPPVALTFLRWLVAVLALAPFIWPRVHAQWPLVRRHWLLIVASGALGMAGYSALAYIALATTTAANVAFLNSTVPLMVPLVMLFFAREPMGPRAVFGLLISFVGVIWIIARGDLVNLAHLAFTHGDLITLLAVAMYAVYLVLVRQKPRALELMVFLFGGMVAALVLLLPFTVLEYAQGARIPLDAKSLLTVLYIGLVISLLAYLLWNHCVITLGPSITGPAYHLISVFTPIVAYFFLGERLYGYHYAGIGLILAGVVCASWRRR